jgi:hypothetical protein
MVNDSSGNLYINGSYSGTGNINPFGTPYTLTNPLSTQQPFVAKYDANLNLQWIMNPAQYSTTTTSTMQWFKNIVMNPGAGDIYVTGPLLGTMTLPTASGTWTVTASTQTNFVMGLDRNTGNLDWFAEYAPALNSLATDGAGNLYMEITINGAAAAPWTYLYGPGTGGKPITFSPTENGLAQGAFVKCDSSGNIFWSGNFSTQNGARTLINPMAVDATGNIYFSGLLCDQGATADLDTGPGVKNLTAVTQGDVVIGKINTQGNLAWVVHNSLTPNQQPEDVVVDANGNVDVGFNYPFPYAVSVTVTGHGRNQNTTVVGGNLVQFDNNGNLKWYAMNTGATGNMMLDPAGNIYMVPGGYAGTVPAYELNKYSSTGNLVWSVPNYNYPINSISIDNLGDIWTNGGLGNPSSASYDVSPTSTPVYLPWTSTYPMMLVKWTQPGGFATAAPIGAALGAFATVEGIGGSDNGGSKLKVHR